MIDELRRIGLFTSGIAELTRNRAEQVVKQWVREGELRRDQATSAVKSLLEVSSYARNELLGLVRAEIREQVQSLGLASQRDLERLERKVERLERERRTQRSEGRKKTTAKPTGRGATKKTARRPRPPDAEDVP